MVSKECLETMVFYQPEIKYKLIKLLDSNAGRAATYFMPIMPVTDCLSERTEYTNKYRMCIKNIVLVREKIIGRSIIRIDDKEYIYIIVRFDVAESLLKRNAIGIRLTELLLE